MKSTTSPDHPYAELGRRLLAAVISYRLGIGLDYALKKYVPQDINPSWCELGRALLTGMTDHFVAAIRNDLPQ